jgi:hypothetical protein
MIEPLTSLKTLFPPFALVAENVIVPVCGSIGVAWRGPGVDVSNGSEAVGAGTAVPGATSESVDLTSSVVGVSRPHAAISANEIIPARVTGRNMGESIMRVECKI